MDHLDEETRKRVNKNLKPFPKGKSGNLKGAPKGKHLSTILKELLDTDLKAKNSFTGKKETKTLSEWICNRLIATALSGKTKAMGIIFDRTEGKVEEKLNMKLEESANVEAIKDKMKSYFKRNNVDEEKK